jgi:hypothetical protein
MLGGPCTTGDWGGGGGAGRPLVFAALAAGAGFLLGSGVTPFAGTYRFSATPVRVAQSSQPPQQPAQHPQPKPAPRRPDAPTSSEGEQFFYNRDAGPAKIACADCHLVTAPNEPPPDDLIRAGHSLQNAFGRGTWWNGRVMTDCGEAGEVCFKRFMGGQEFDGRTRTAIVLYIKGRSEPASSPWIIQRVPPGRVDVTRGDFARGADIFRRACSLCHGAGGGPSGPDLKGSKMTPREIADVVRTGVNRMPFFQADLLSDDQVADVAAYAYALRPRSD